MSGFSEFLRGFGHGLRKGVKNGVKEGRQAAKEGAVTRKVAKSGVGSLTKSEKEIWNSMKGAREGEELGYEALRRRANKGNNIPKDHTSPRQSAGTGNGGHVKQKNNLHKGNNIPKDHTSPRQSAGTGNGGHAKQKSDLSKVLRKVEQQGEKSLTKEESKIYNQFKNDMRHKGTTPGGENRVSGGGPGGKGPTTSGGSAADAEDISMGKPANEHWWRNHLTHFGSEMLKNPKALATWVALAWMFDEHREAEKHGLSLVQELTGWATGYQYDEDGKVIGVNGLGSLLGTMASGSEAVKDGTGAFPQLSNELLGQQATDTIGDSAQWTVDTIQNGVNTAGQHLDKWVNGAETAASDGYDAVKDGAAAVKDHIQNSDGGNSYSYTDGADQGGQAAGNYSGRSAAPAGLNAGGVQLGFNPNRYAFDSSATVGSAMASLLARNPLAKIAMIGASGYFGNRTRNDYQGYQQNRQYSQQMQPHVEEQPTVAARGVSF